MLLRETRKFFAQIIKKLEKKLLCAHLPNLTLHGLFEFFHKIIGNTFKKISIFFKLLLHNIGFLSLGLV